MQAITPNQTLQDQGAHYCIANPAAYDGPRFMEGPYGMASQVLAEHFDPSDDICDCSRENPCEVAARYLLATGRVEGARGHVFNGRPSNYIADPAPGGEGAPVGPSGRTLASYTVQDTTPNAPGKGTGSGGGRRKNGPKPVTEPQIATLKSLTDQLNEVSGTPRDHTQLLEDLEHMTAKEASGLIDGLKGALAIARREARQAQNEQNEKAQQELVEGGMYRHGEDIYWLVRAKSSQRLYAKRVVIDDEEASLEYAGGMVRHLDASQQLSSEEALEIASLYGKCMVCHRKLSKKESIEAGIGPICAEKF